MPTYMDFQHLPVGTGPSVVARALGVNAVKSSGVRADDQIVAGGYYQTAWETAGGWIAFNCEHATLMCAGHRRQDRVSSGGTVSGANYIAWYEDASGNKIVGLRTRDSSNTLDIMCSGVSVGTINVPAWATEWYIELCCKIANNGGAAGAAGDGWVRVLIDGGAAADVSVSGINTKAAAHGNISDFRISGADTAGDRSRFRRIYTKQATDDVSAPGHHGPIVFNILTQESDTVSDWTPSTGTDNYALVDEVPASTADYVSTTTIGDVDEGPVSDLPVGVNSILAVVRTALASAPAGGAPQVQLGVKTSEGTDDGNNLAIGSTAERTIQSVYTTKPTGGAWTIARVNELSLRRVAAA